MTVKNVTPNFIPFGTKSYIHTHIHTHTLALEKKEWYKTDFFFFLAAVLVWIDFTQEVLWLLGTISTGPLYIAKVLTLFSSFLYSCCVDEVAAEHYQADSIIHFGATCLSPTQRLPVLYVLCCEPVDIVHAADQVRAVCTDSAARLILMADTMYQHALGEYFTNGIQVIVAR